MVSPLVLRELSSKFLAGRLSGPHSHTVVDRKSLNGIMDTQRNLT
jgi:hypothetical protein